MNNSFIHKDLASERWQAMPLHEQLANIGSEASRALFWKQKNDEEKMWSSSERMLELLDLTIEDKRWRTRLKEMLRLREVICDFLFSENIYGSSSDMIENYFLPFALQTRR